MTETEDFTGEPSSGYSPQRMRRIMVGLDGSADSARAAAYASDLAKMTGASIVAAHAVGLLEHVGDAAETVRAALTGQWVEPFRRAGVLFEVRVAEGPPADTLAAMAERLDVDLVVVGTRGAGNAVGVIGSTASKLVAESTSPVLVVPPPERGHLRDRAI
jgi:nucleotide-binding universal stress UspA family protein